MAILAVAAGNIGLELLSGDFDPREASISGHYVAARTILYPSTGYDIGCKFEPVSDVWLNVKTFWGSSIYTIEAGVLFLALRNGMNNIVRLVGGGTLGANGYRVVDVEIWDGSSWVVVATSNDGLVITNSGLDPAVILRVTLGVNGRIFLAQGGVPLVDYTGDTSQSGQTHVNAVVINSPETGSSNALNLDGIIIADEDPTDFVLSEVYPSGDGAETGWVGGEPQVDDIGSTLSAADGDFIAASAPGLRETFTKPNLHSDFNSGYDVVAVVDVARVRRNGSGPNLQFLSRHGTDNHAGATISPGTAFAPVSQRWHTNPATGQPWTVDEINARQFGVQSV